MEHDYAKFLIILFAETTPMTASDFSRGRGAKLSPRHSTQSRDRFMGKDINLDDKFTGISLERCRSLEAKVPDSTDEEYKWWEATVVPAVRLPLSRILLGRETFHNT
jgi:hypothetical protein